MKDKTEDMIYLQEQLEKEKLTATDGDGSRLATDEATIPYADEITYPKNWREIINHRARQPAAPSNGVMPSQRPSMQYGYMGPIQSQPRAALDPALLASVTEDEIWVIARENAPRPVGAEYDTPRSGAMLAQIKEEKVPLPLKHTDVKGAIAGYIATVDVTQQYQNPFGEKIEAVYVFPLPENAAVNEFVMTIGERRIRGIIRERAGGRDRSTRRPAARATSPRCSPRSGRTSSPRRSPTSSPASRSTSTSATSTPWPTTTAGTSSSSRWSSARGSTRPARPTASARSAAARRGISGQNDRSPVPQARRAQRPRHLAGAWTSTPASRSRRSTAAAT